MFRALASRQTHADKAAESDDDTISLTSTAPSEHDPDQEFNVQGILAISESGSHYLVEWEGFPIYQSTWEPIEELGDELARMWEERKEEEACGKVEPFDVDAWKATVLAHKDAKEERQFRRNRKRKKLGLLQTEPILTTRTPSNPDILEEATASIGIESESSGSDSEAEVRDEPPAEPADRPQHQAAADKNKGKGVGKATAVLPPLRTSSIAGVSATSRPETSGTDSRRASTSQASTVSKPISPPPRRATAKDQATTGYQGTARRLTTKPAPARNAVGPSTAAPRSPPGHSEPPPKNTAAGKSKASGKGPLTAKRTTTALRTGNIFTSGKVRKTKPGFKEVLGDTSQAPRMFSNHHIRRAAEKKALEERAPDPANLQLFSLVKGLPARKSSTSGANALSPISPSTQVAGSLHQMQLDPASRPAAPSLPVKKASVLESGPASGEAASPVPLPAKSALKPALKSRASTGASAKRVVFADESEDHGELFVSTAIIGSPEPMDYEPTANLERPVGRVLRSPPPPETKPTWKKMTLGRHAAMNVLFTGLPAISDHRLIPWRDAFFGSGLETLRVRHICLAQNVKIKLPNLVFENFNEASGSLEAKDGNGTSVEAVARFLASGFLGLYYPHPKFNLLVYPAKCDEWKAAMAGHEGPSDPDAVLRFWICDAAFDFTTIMRPWGWEAAPSPPQSTVHPNTHSQETISLMQRWFSFDYQMLLPVRNTTSSGSGSFFLAFPSSKLAHVTVLSNWLLACNPACRIFVGLQHGSWEAFTSTLREDQSAGVVIVHESLVWTLRRFPRLHESLQRMDDQYWCFSDPDRPRPVFPSMRLVEESRSPATPQFIRLFPDRSAILLTPSFLVSEPQATRRLLDWFLSNRAKHVGTRLVSGWDLQEYLSDLAKEKADERQEVKSSQYGNSEFELQSRGLSQEECNDRFISSVKAMELHNLRLARSGPYEADEEDNSALIYAPPYIDPNDEQSLVNWFGWWSLQRADQLRQLWVLGTDEPRSRTRKFERRVRIPKYTRVTINDPEVVLETIQQHRSDVTAQQSEQAAVRAQSSNPVARDDTGSVNYLSPKSDVLHSDDAKELHGALSEIRASRLRLGGPITLFHHPVSWDDVDMVHHFSDPMENYNRISTWWKFAHPFAFQTNGFNTYIGFFYTLEEEWNPAVIPKGPKPKRHPWIVAYRPVNLFKRPYNRCEVIIWDPCAPTKYPGRHQVGEKELSYMQRRVIQVVRERCAEKNIGTWLDQVWLGGFASDSFPGDDSPYPIDRTLNWLDATLKNFKKYLPAPEQLMTGRGFIPVIPDTAAPVRPLPIGKGPQNLGDAPMELDSSGSELEDDEDTRMIFHPPRGSKLPPGQRTRCINRLYEAARLAKARNERETTMVYNFPSTTTWYREQVEEGRDYQHITFETNFESFLEFFYPRANPIQSKASQRIFD
ncbi:hypothetical protein B0T18DRAFT_393577 [Schizothecium vesticola]|uniref:Chromo domain-containing protein n=1 Tax=Schizothecium vesticola TaxID=314040 RepID=A0AA40JZL5_9PEZI|nr:hypothetical protein B0T18DRAFT_393577 [Schizothecium vesticola]